MEQQDPPYRKKVYDLLSTNFSDFGKTEEEFYSALDADTAYAGKVHEVLKTNFADFGRERNEFVSMLSGGEKKSPGSTASPLGSPEPSATPQLPSGGIKVPPAALPGLGSLSVPYRAPAAEQAASPAQDQPAPEPVKPTAQAPAAQRNPLADFEELSSKRMNIQAAESAMTSGGDKFERMISQSASEKMSPSVKAEKERLDKSFSSIMPEVDKQVDEFLKYLNPQSYVMKDVSGLPTVDSEKLSYVAKAKADQLGLPEGGHAWKLLWNAAKDHVAYEIKRPLIEKEAKQIYKETYGADMTADAEKMAKGFGIEAYKARAESSLDNFAKRQMEEQRQLAESEVAAFTNGMPTDKYVESINASRDAAIQELDAAFSMNMTPEGFSGSQQEYDAYKNRFDAINKTAEQAFASILEVETKAMAGANRRYNRAVEEEADRIQRGFERFASQKQPEMEKAVADRVRDAYKKASEKVGEDSEFAKRALDRGFASEFVLPFTSMFGSWVKSMGSAAGSRDLQEWGDFVSTKYNIGSTEIKEWSDWFTDARLALRSTGALAGSMAGTMIPAIAAGVATGGVGGGVGAQTLAGGATGFLAETVDLSSRMYDDTFAETGDAALAMNRAKKVFDSQLILAPTYSIDMLPFFGKFSGGIVKRFLKGAAMEYGSELVLQEYPQNAFEKAIKKDAELSEVYKFMSFEDFNNTAKNVVGVIPMGGGGQVYQAIKENEESKAADKRLNDNAKSIVAKLKLGKLSESQIQENLLNVVANHGVKQADAVVSAMMASGSITYEQAGGLLSDIKAAEGFVQSASEQNLGNSESYVFTNLRMKLRQAEKIAETEQDPLKKEFAEKNVSKIKKDLEDIFDGKDSRYATISYPNGSFQVLTYDEARKAMKKDGFADTFRNGEVKFEAFGSDAQKLTEELAGIIGRPPISEELLTNDQQAAISANKKLTEITGGAIGGEAEVESEILAAGTESNKQTQAEPAKQPETEVVSESESNKTAPTETVEQAEEVAPAEAATEKTGKQDSDGELLTDVPAAEYGKAVRSAMDSGNFKGFVASDSKKNVDDFMKLVGDTSSEFSTKSLSEPIRKTEVNDKIKELQKSIWGDLNTQGVAWDPKNEAESARKMGEKLTELARLMIEATGISAKEFIDQQIANAMALKGEIYDGLKMAIKDIATKAYEAAKFLPKDKEKKKGKGKSRKKAYERRLMKEYKNSDSLKKAIQANGLDYNVVSWKTVLPMSNEIVSSIFAEKNYVEGIKQLAEDIESTTVADYRGNEHLSTLHALIAHQVIDELARRGDVKNFRKWTDYFSSDARSQGRFISAMQEDASPFAARNRAMRSATKQADVAMERATTDGRKVQEHVDEIQEKLKLTEKEVERLTKVIEDLVKQKPPKPQAPPTGSMPQGPTSPRGITSGKAKIQSGLSKLQLGARKARGLAPLGTPLNKEIIEGVKELAEGLIQEGIYQADMLIAAVMKEVKKALRGDKELIKEIEKNIESILDIESVEEMMEEDENEKFVQKLVARAKANILDKAPKQKTAEDVLIDVLLNKINEGLPKTKRERVDNTYRKLAEAIANREFSDEIWQQAMRDVESWLDRARITPEQKAEALGRLEEMASGFMEQPFSNSDLRKAIRLGIKDAGVEVAKVVREHMTKQNATMASLEERLIRELGLDPQSATEYTDVFSAELEKLFEETRAKEINRILNLDTAGMPKKKAERVNRRTSDRIMQAMNLGILSDANFRQVFSEKYGFPNIDREKLAMIGMLNDLIHKHQGTEMSRFYEKQLMDYIESLKPWDARKMAVESYSMMIRGMLTGIVTNAVNIPIGSLMSFTAGAMPRILANPVATAAFLKEFNTTGMKGIGKQSFKSVMESGFDPMDGSTQKFEDRGNVTGSSIDYYLNSYDLSGFIQDFRSSKGLPGKMKSLAISSARTYLMMSKIANFAQAFDALMSYKGSELDQFIAEYNEQMRLAGGMARNMDTAAIKRIIENTKQYMGYVPDLIEETQDKVDAEIAAMTARGEKVPPGLRQRRIKEELSTRRDVEKVKASLDRVREFVLMEKPQGFSGQAYRAFTEATAIKEGDSTTGVATKMFAKLAFGLFLRITVSSAQRITENVPGVSLALPGIFYEWQNLPVDPKDPNGKKEWRMAPTPKDKMKARLMTHAAVSALAMGAAMVMFSVGDEEEDKYGRKSRKLKLNPDRWLDITGIGTGKWYQNEVLREGDRERKDFMLSIKVNGRWHDIIPARLMPHLLPMIGILGGMRDMATLNPDGFEDATMEEQLANGFDDMAFGMTSFTYASIPKTAQKLMLASNKESSIESGMSLAEEMGTIVLNPMRSAIYLNVLRDVRNEYKAVSGDPALMGKGLMWAVAKEVPIAEDMVGNERHDPFGYEKVRTSKVLNAAKEVPGLSIVIDHPMYHAMANEGRFSEPVWKLKSEYHPNLLVNNHYPQGQTADDADLMNKVYGEKMRGLWLSNEEYVKAYDHSQMAKLQEFFNSEAVYLMKMSVAEERVEKLSMAFEEGKKSKVFTSKLGKIEEEMNKWKRVMTHDAPIEYLQEMPETFKAYTEMEMSPEATDARKKSFMINNGLPVLD